MPAHAIRFAVAVCIPVLLAACGGGASGSVASTPAPIASPAPSSSPPPVTVRSEEVVKTPLAGLAGQVAGTSQAIAVLYERGSGANANDIGPQSARIMEPTAVRLTSGGQAKTYTLEIALAGYPASQTFDLGHIFKDGFGSTIIGDSDFGNHIVRTTHYSDGTKATEEYDDTSRSHTLDVFDTSPTTAQQSTFWFDLGLRYVSFGTWNRQDLQRITVVTPACRSGQCLRSGIDLAEQEILFVTGRRTLASELPRTGTATYEAGIRGRPFLLREGETINAIDNLMLTADFARMLMTGSISSAPYNDGEYYSLGVKAAGSGAITASGSYAFPLGGTITSPFEPVQTWALGGSLQGGLFGPGAEEAGGVLILTQNGNPAFIGTFAGGRTSP